MIIDYKEYNKLYFIGEIIMALSYRKASLADLEILTKTRIEVLRAANQLSADVDMSEVKNQSREYYQSSLKNDSHLAYLIFDEETFVGTGGISYYQVMPTYHNPTGKKAYIMNIYTNPKYRRRGIAFHTLDLLVADARKKGIIAISLEATDMGRPLYEKYGFIKMNDEMELPN